PAESGPPQRPVDRPLAYPRQPGRFADRRAGGQNGGQSLGLPVVLCQNPTPTAQASAGETPDRAGAAACPASQFYSREPIGGYAGAAGVPEADAPVVQRRGQAVAGGRKGQGVDEVGLFLEGQQLQARGDLPEPDHFVFAGGGQATARSWNS